MSGSRLGRGRGGRQAIYGACGVVVVLLIFFYRAATTEMSRLRELHVQCAQQHEALEAQLQVIYEYKARLEKSLAEEKNSNAAVKQELQQRASREKSLRDKDSVEAMQRYSSLQQTHKLLQTEHQDLREECDKQRNLASEQAKKLETRVNELKTQIREIDEDKKKSMEHLKTKYLELDTEKTRLEDKYDALVKSNGNTDGRIDHLRKEVMQLQRELNEAQNSCKATSPGSIVISQKSDQLGQPNVASEGGPVVSVGEQQGNRPSPQQQVSRPSNDVVEIPRPIQAPRDHQPIRNNPDDNNNKNNGDAAMSDVTFVRRGGNIVPAGADDVDNAQEDSDKASLPLPYVPRPDERKNDDGDDDRKIREDDRNGNEAPPNSALPAPKNDDREVERSSAKSVKNFGPMKKFVESRGADETQIRSKNDRRHEEPSLPSAIDEIHELENKVAGILNNAE